jgi:hypothetical protein
MSLSVEYASIAQCRPEHLWQVFEQIELWPRWSSDAIANVHWVSGNPWSKGARFSIELRKPMPFKLTPEVMEVDSPIYVHLRGQGSGVTGDQFYIFKLMPDLQTTELRTLQEFSGKPIQILGKAVRPAIEAGIRHMFARVTEEAEAIARAESPGSPVQDPEPPSGDPPLPPSEPRPPIGDPAPPPRDPVPQPGEPAPPIGDPAPSPDTPASISEDFPSSPCS